MRLRTRARVQMLIEINDNGVWGEDCTVAQVHKQAVSVATQFLRRLLSGEAAEKVSVLETHVVATTFEEDKT